MIHSRGQKRLLAATLVAANLSTLAAGAQAAEQGADDGEAQLEVVVTGTRRAERTAIESTAPIDIVSQKDLASTFSADFNNKLQALVPSYNVRRLPLNDGAIFVRPASLRGLSPDHTLVLFNGKRRHRSAFVDVTSRGSQGPDIAQVPQVAIKRVEVLRDGAAAQYGSDAIAGVINFILEDKEGTSGYLQYGEYAEGDGAGVQAAVNSGFALGESGKLSLSLEYSQSDATSRSVQRPQALALIALGEPFASSIRQPVVQRFGQPDLESYRFFYNGSFEIGDGAEAYAFGNYSDTSGVSDFNWRPPAAAAGAAANPAYRVSVFQTGPNAVFPNFRLSSVFPGGFTPRFGSDLTDYSSAVGVRGDITPKLSWDVSANYGRSKVAYNLTETINASLGPLSPTSFDAGSRTQAETTANLDFVYRWDAGLAEPVNVGFGAEYRREEFGIQAGEEASWVVGPLRDLTPGSNGFPGASPLSAGSWTNTNTAAYVDVDVDVGERWNIALAGRFEDYSTFGTTTNGKLSTRLELTEALSLRGTVSTGFRAPTPGQSNLSNFSQGPNSVNVILTSGIFPPDSAASRLFGGIPLKPEESTNYSLGFVWAPRANFNVTVDAYQIDIDDRIGISQFFTPTAAQRAALVSAGVQNANELDRIRFFSNAFATRTQGVDVVASFREELGPGRLNLTGAVNYNNTVLTRRDPAVISDVSRLQITRAIPLATGNVSADYEWQKFRFFARARYFGAWLWATGGASGLDATANQRVPARTFVDLAATYAFSDNVDVTLGAENVLDQYTPLTQFNQAIGRKYPGQTPYENDGRQAYLRVGIRF